VEVGINEKGYCVFREFETLDGSDYFEELLISGPNISTTVMESTRDPVYRFGLAISGKDLAVEDKNPIYIYATTFRELSVFLSATKAVAASARTNGLCVYSPQVSSTFNTKSKRILLETSSPRKKSGKFFSGLSFRKKKDRRESDVSMNSVSREIIHEIVIDDTPYLLSIIQCCDYFEACDINSSGFSMYGTLSSQQSKMQAETIAKSLFSKIPARPSLKPYPGDVVCDLLLQSLFKMKEPLIPDSEYIRFAKAVNKLLDLDIDLGKSPGLARASFTLVSNLSARNAFALSRICHVIARFVENSGGTTSVPYFAELLGGLLIESLQDDILKAESFRYGLVDIHSNPAVPVLLEILSDRQVSVEVFNACFQSAVAKAGIQSITPVIDDDATFETASDAIKVDPSFVHTSTIDDISEPSSDLSNLPEPPAVVLPLTKAALNGITVAAVTSAPSELASSESSEIRQIESTGVSEPLIFDDDLDAKIAKLQKQWPQFQGDMDYDPFGVDRIDNINSMIKWYSAKLNVAPESRNAPLWEREIEYLQAEANAGEDKMPSFFQEEDGSDVLRLERSKMLESISKCWVDCKHASVDSLTKAHSVIKKNFTGSSRDDRMKIDTDPLLLFDESDSKLGLLEQELGMIEVHLKDLSVANDQTPELLLQILKENISLRLELNQYQRGVVERTKEKAAEFHKSFNPHAAPSDTVTKNAPGIAPSDTVTKNAPGMSWTLSGLFQ